MIQEQLKKIEGRFDEIIGKTPHDSRLLEVSGRKICALCGHPFKGDKVVEELRTFLRTSALELVKSVLSQEIERLEKNKRKLPYKPKSPFQGESVDFHLKTYGHLPSRGCCEFDQYTEEQVENYNSALSSSIASLQEIIKIK